MICCPKCKESLEGLKLNPLKVKLCPYCGENLDMGDLLDSSKDLLKFYVGKFGKEIFLAEKKSELLEKIDKWPADLKNDADIIKLLYLKNIPMALAKSCDLNEEGRAGVWEECMASLTEGFGFSAYQAKRLLSVVAVPLKNENFFEDPRDGQVYSTVKVGDQVWFAENFRLETDDSMSIKNDSKNDSKNDLKCGRLYTWNDAMKKAPKGWHLPSREEYKTLFSSVLSSSKSEKKDNALKLLRERGFDLSIVGYIDQNKDFNDDQLCFWTFEEYFSDRAYYECLSSNQFYETYDSKKCCNSVRYVKD